MDRPPEEIATARIRHLENKMAIYREKMCDITDEIEELHTRIEIESSTLRYLDRLILELETEKQSLVNEIYKIGKQNV